MKRVLILGTLVTVMVALLLAIPQASMADSSLLGPGTPHAVAIPASEMQVPVPTGGETEFYDAATGAGLCCQFTGTCTGVSTFFAGDSMIFNNYWQDTATASSMTFNVLTAVSPNGTAASRRDIFNGPVTYTGLTPGTTYNFCVGISVNPVPATPPLCSWFWGYVVNSPANGIGQGSPFGGLNINC